MIEEQGRVIDVDDQFVEVETIRTSSCSACKARVGCGHHAVAQLSSSNRMKMKVMKTIEVEAGQEVIVGIPEDSLLKASLWMYFVPLVFMVLGATLPTLLTEQSIWSVIFALIGFVGGFYFARIQAQKAVFDPEFMPRILRVKTVERSKISIYQHL